MTDPAEAADLGRRVPLTLPEVFELELEYLGGQGHRLREVLAALAFGRGDGLPVSVACRLAGVIRTAPRTDVTPEEAREALALGRFYLRRGRDRDGTSLFRLFHEGLAEHLRRYPAAPGRSPDPQLGGRLVEALLAPLGPVETRDWEAAEPYVLNHVLDHAAERGWSGELLTDPEFLLAAAPAPAAFPDPPDPAVRAYVAALRHRRSASQELRPLMALTAARAGHHELAERIARPPAGPPLLWWPLWTAPGSGARPAEVTPAPLGEPVHIGPEPVGAAALTWTEQGLIAAMATGRTVQLWNVTTSSWHGTLPGHRGVVTAVATGRLGNRPIVVTGGTEQVVRVWDPASGEQCHAPLTGPKGVIQAVAVTSLDGCPVVLAGGTDGRLWLWDLASGDGEGVHFTGNARSVTSLAAGWFGSDTLAITGNEDGTALIWDLRNKMLRHSPLTGHVGAVAAVALASRGGTVVALTGDDNAAQIWSPAQGDDAAVAFATGTFALQTWQRDGRLFALTAGVGGTVGLWDLTGPVPGELAVFRSGEAHNLLAAAVMPYEGTMIGLTGGRDPRARLWRLGPAERAEIVAVMAHDAGVLAVSGSAMGDIVTRSARTGAPLHKCPHPEGGVFVRAQPVNLSDCSLLALRDTDGTHWSWEPGPGPGARTAPAVPRPSRSPEREHGTGRSAGPARRR